MTDIKIKSVEVKRIAYKAILISRSGREYPILCHDNAAMIQGLAYLKIKTLKLCDECGAPMQLSEFNELYCPECILTR